MDKFSYWFDNFFATNPMAKVYLLCTINIVFMVFFGVIFHISGSQGGDWAENFWMGFTFAADMAEDDHGGPFPYWKQWMFRVMNFTFSFGGAFVFGLVINFLSSWIDDRVTGLRQGKTKVLEKGHTLIIGWNDRILSLIHEIAEANCSEGGLPIVIVADRDKIEMDDWLQDALGDDDNFEKGKLKNSKIVTRQGNPIEPSRLRKGAVRYARSLIVLSEGEDPDEADAQAVRRVLALTAGLEAAGIYINSEPYKAHIVLEIQDIDNAEVAMLGVTSGIPEDVVVPVISHDIVGKLMIQCTREIGLNKCFGALMTFDGSECYFSTWDAGGVYEYDYEDGPSKGEPYIDDGMTGKTFQSVLFRFSTAAVIGVRFANLDSPEVLAINPSGRPVMLNPDGDYVMQYGDKVLAVAEDNDTFWFGQDNMPDKTPLPPFNAPPPQPETFLLAGWRRDMDDIVRELDKWAPPGSHLTLFNRFSTEKQVKQLANGGMLLPGDGKDTNLFKTEGIFENIASVELIKGNCCSGKELSRLGPKKLESDDDERVPNSRYRIEDFDNVLTLSINTKITGMSADSRVMVSMLIIRHLQETRGAEGKTLVAEIKDPRTQELMSFTNCTDSVVGNEIVAMILAQISEDRDIGYVMEDLFSEEGMEMHVKDVRLFLQADERLNWWELVDRCAQRNMLLMGWIMKGGDHKQWSDLSCTEGAILNPPDKDSKMAFNCAEAPHGDLLIVISEN
jgi:hypothetical protein